MIKDGNGKGRTLTRVFQEKMDSHFDNIIMFKVKIINAEVRRCGVPVKKIGVHY